MKRVLLLCLAAIPALGNPISGLGSEPVPLWIQP